MLLLRRRIERYSLGACLLFRSLSSDAAGGFKRNQKVVERDLEDPGVEASPAPSEVNVREFFKKYKPPAKPAPPQPKKEWLLRRQPEPEELLEQSDHGPRAGDIFAESEWLHYGSHVSSRQKLITNTPEFNRIAKSVESESQKNRATHPRASSPSRYIPAFSSSTNVNSHHVPSSSLDHPPMDWSNEVNAQQAHSGSQPYYDLDRYFEADTSKTDGSKQQAPDHKVSGEVSTTFSSLADEKTTRSHEMINPTRNYDSEDNFGQHQTSQSGYAGSPTQWAHVSVEQSSQQDNTFDQLVMEELSEEAQFPNEEQPKTYDYKPPLPRWLDPPDGDSVGAVPQREYNDFSPSKTLHDFWTESSVTQFEDPGQDPAKPDRHKLWGQEYWVAKPMLMEKYDYGEDGDPYTTDTRRPEELDPEIPLHFVEKDGTIAKLSIPEAEDYSHFFDTEDTNQRKGIKRRLFSMSDTDKGAVKTMALKQGKVRVSGKVLNGYTVPEGDVANSDALNKGDVEDWLYDTPTPRDDGFSPYYYTAYSGVIDTEEAELTDGYGKYDVFMKERRLPVPSPKRVEEVKELEGLKELQIKQMAAALNGVSSNNSAARMADADLQRLAEAESRYQDIFTNELSDELPDLASVENDRIDSLRRLNTEDVREERPNNNLLDDNSPSDSDQWMLKELEKLRKHDGIVEDPFSLVCHPKMLEIAFASLRRRRPGSVPKSLENNFFEMASRLLLTGEMKASSIAPSKPLRDAGKGARSTRIPSHSKPHPHRD